MILKTDLLALAVYAIYAPLPDFWHHVLRRGVYSRGNGSSPQVSLTFDDGPDPRYTPLVLEVLAQRQVKATFFLVGQRVLRYPKLVREILANGHEIGNHTFHHRPAWLLPPWATRSEVLEGERIIRQVAGSSPLFFRPPWGLFNLSTAFSPGAKPVLWSIHGYDWRRQSTPAKIARRIVDQARPGCIILLHDAGGAPGAPGNTCKALPLILDGLAEKGLHPVSLSHLLPRR